MKIILFEQTGTNKGNLCCFVIIWIVWIQFFKYLLSRNNLFAFFNESFCSELNCYFLSLLWVKVDQGALIEMKIGYNDVNSFSFSDFQETSVLILL